MSEDQRLIKRLIAKDKDALRLIYEKYIDDLLRVAMSLLYDIQSAEDCLHDVFVSFAADIDRLAKCRNIKKYLVSCVANRARDMLRKKNSLADFQTSSLLPENTSCDPTSQLICDEQSACVFESLSQLPYQQREIFALHVQGELKFKEIADLLDISINTVQSRYRYAISKLRQELKKGES